MADEELQPGLFDDVSENVLAESVVFYALADFQMRGFELVNRTLALDRLLGAFKRAFEHFDMEAIPDDELASSLRRLGAKVEQVPRYVAKHPFRVTVSEELAQRSLERFTLDQQSQ